MLHFKPKPKMNDYSFIRLSYVQYLVKIFPDFSRYLFLITNKFLPLANKNVLCQDTKCVDT